MAKKKNIQTYEKRRKEQDRLRKQEEKRQRRFNKNNSEPSGEEYSSEDNPDAQGMDNETDGDPGGNETLETASS